MTRRASAVEWGRIAYAVAGLTVALVLLASQAAGASVAVRLGGMFSIAPARHRIVARPPAQLAPTEVANTTLSTLRVRVFPVLLAQTISGAFTFDSSPAGLLAARQVLAAAPSGFGLAPDSSRQVELSWRRLPAHTRTAVVGVVYQATPSAGRGPVRIVEQLLGVNMLRLPGRYRFTGRLTGVHVTQVKPGTLRFILGVQNTGQAVAGPSRLLLTVRDQHGALLVHRRLATDIVLPGATRDFVLDIGHKLPAGSYTVRAHAAFGSSRRLSATGRFELVGPNELPAAELRVGPLTARGVVGQGAELDATLQNTGTVAGNTAIDLSLYRLIGGVPGQRPVASRRLVTDSIAPGNSSRLRSAVGELRRGSYRLIASYEDSSGAPQTLVADFQAQLQPGVLARLRSFESEHLLLTPLAILLASGAAIALLLVRERRLKRALAAAGAAVEAV
jgi:hypothetical protein